MTGAAAPIERGGVPAVNVSALAPVLGLSVRADDDGLVITTGTGTEWRARNGDISLEGSRGSLPLRSPLMVQGAGLYLSIDVVAELAGLRLDLDRASEHAGLGSRLGEVARVAGEWEAFTIEKTPQQKAQLAEEEGGGAGIGRGRERDVRLPGANVGARLTVGVGHVQGADWGLELLGSGKVGGAEVNLGAFLTMGHKGLDIDSGRLSVVDEEFGRGAEVGDLHSELYGLRRGVRYSWRAGETRWPSVALYLSEPQGGKSDMVLAYRDEFRLNRHVSVGGELATDGSLLLKERFRDERLSLYGYQRSMSEGSGDGMGGFASYDIGNRVSLYGGISRTGSGADQSDWRSLSVRLPLRPGVNVTLDVSRMATESTSNTIKSAILSFPAGPVRMMTQYRGLHGRTRFSADPAAQQTALQNRELIVSALYFGHPRLSFDYQVSTRWQDDGASQRWEQLVSTYRLSPRTELQAVSAFPQMLDSDQLRLRLRHALRKDLALIVDYGSLAPYQAGGSTSGRGFTVMLRRRFSIRTPARGGVVRGRVVDQVGQGVSGALVRLNSYGAMTDSEGRYIFRHVPPGAYEVSLDESGLSADYNAGDGAQQVKIASRSNLEMDFRAVPLHAITGRAYCDKDGDGEYDPGEGVRAVVLHLDGSATASDKDGSFGFYNLEPGQHTIRLDRDRLPRNYVPASPTETTVHLPADQSVSGVSFRLTKRVKQIIFHDLE